MSELKPFPNTLADQEKLHSIAEWPEKQLEDKVVEYWQFKERTDLMPRAIKAANRILEHLGFEVDYRAGIYAPQTEAQHGEA